MNGPATTTVTCTATDAIGNQTIDSFRVTVTSPFGYIPDYVALGREWVTIGANTTVRSGNVGVLDASARVPGGNGFELVAGANDKFTGGSQLAAQSVLLNNFVHAGDTFFVDKLLTGTGATAVARTGYIPLFSAMPSVPPPGPGGTDLTLNGIQTLAPGDYGHLTIQSNSDITLDGGTYTFTSLRIGFDVTVRFSAATTIVVAGQARLADRTIINATPTADVPPRKVLLYVLGTDGSPSTEAFSSGSNTRLALNIYVPNGTLSIGSHNASRGAFIARRVQLGSNLTLDLDSVFVQP
jgi:hypothetical protein